MGAMASQITSLTIVYSTVYSDADRRKHQSSTSLSFVRGFHRGHFPRYWPFVLGIHRSPVNSPHKGQWRGAVMFSLICALNKRLSKQSWGWWFETASQSLLRHCNDYRSACLSKGLKNEIRISLPRDFKEEMKKRHLTAGCDSAAPSMPGTSPQHNSARTITGAWIYAYRPIWQIP